MTDSTTDQAVPSYVPNGNLSNLPHPFQHRCPHCGHCPHCGRSDRMGAYPVWPQPYPVYPSFPGWGTLPPAMC